MSGSRSSETQISPAIAGHLATEGVAVTSGVVHPLHAIFGSVDADGFISRSKYQFFFSLI